MPSSYFLFEKHPLVVRKGLDDQNLLMCISLRMLSHLRLCSQLTNEQSQSDCFSNEALQLISIPSMDVIADMNDLTFSD